MTFELTRVIALLTLLGCPGSSGSGDVACPDADSDGYDACEDAPEDCDDLNEAVHPGAAELCDDGIDNDCSGDGSPEFAEGTVPSTASSLPIMLTEKDTCGFWLLPMDEHLLLALHVGSELPDCVLSLGPSLTSPNDPVYTNLSDDGPRYTYDIVAVAVESETTMEVICDEGTIWQALIKVE